MGSADSRTVTVSISPELERQIEELTRLEGRSEADLIREALRRYVLTHRLHGLMRYGSQKTAETGITEDQVDDIIHEYRS